MRDPAHFNLKMLEQKRLDDRIYNPSRDPYSYHMHPIRRSIISVMTITVLSLHMQRLPGCGTLLHRQPAGIVYVRAKEQKHLVK